MNMYSMSGQGFVLPEANCDPADDILVRLDDAGFVVNASQNAARLGVELDALLLMPNVADFAAADHRLQVESYFKKVMAGQSGDEGIEFPITTCRFANACPRAGECSLVQDEHWYELQLTLIDDRGKSNRGTLGRLRSVQHKHVLEEQAAVCATTDPITGLHDRHRYLTELIRQLGRSRGGGTTSSTAVFAIDGMRAIFMQCGQSTADQVRWGFAKYIETMLSQDYVLTQVDEERFGVILPDTSPAAAREWAADALQIFAGLAKSECGRTPELSASAGVAKVERSAEWTIRQAELGLIMARAAGGMQTAICRPKSDLTSGHSIERTMNRVVGQRANRIA